MNGYHTVSLDIYTIFAHEISALLMLSIVYPWPQILNQPPLHLIRRSQLNPVLFNLSFFLLSLYFLLPLSF